MGVRHLKYQQKIVVLTSKARRRTHFQSEIQTVEQGSIFIGDGVFFGPSNF